MPRKYRTPHLSRFADYSRSWNRYLVRTGLRQILDSQREAEAVGAYFQLPSAEALTEQFVDILWEKAKVNSPHDDYRERGPLRFEKIDAMASSAAVFVLDRFDPQYRAKRAAWGRKSRPPVVYTPRHLRGRENLSKAVQAALVGCSTATIAKLRRLIAKRKKPLEVKQQRNAFPGGAEFSMDLFAQDLIELGQETNRQDLIAEGQAILDSRNEGRK